MTTGSVSPRRADTRRNHESILAVAARSLTRSGEVSFNTIARQAGVGVGTVYRHFPTPESLILAVYEREVAHIVEAVPALLEEQPPEQAFQTWVTDRLAHYMMTKRGLAEALQRATRSSEQCGELPSSAFESMLGALTTLLRANVDAGTVRPDVDTMTVMRGLFGLFHLDPDGDWKPEAAKLADLVWRGIRVG